MGDVPADTQDAPDSPSGSPSRSRKRNTGVSKEYLSLLNGIIQDVNTKKISSRLPVSSSQIGATFWNASEKETLLNQLELHGAGDQVLSLLSEALPNKSESEIQKYLALLKKHSTEDMKNPNSGFALETVPAAFEISSECESKLDLAAEQVSARVYNEDAQAARDEYGEDWLIDEGIAEELEGRFEQQTPPDAKLDDSDLESTASGAHTMLDSSAAVEALRPASFLALSRSLFMNNSEDPELNWQNLDAISEEVDAPALFRSALEDFYNLTVNITRRLVQATMFQAMTRLRAADSSRVDWTPVAVVREIDVRTAADFLDMKTNSKEYWRNAARRNKVLVFSDSKKYADGRPGAKAGRQLTYDEVDAELGAEPASSATAVVEPEITESDIDELMEDDDLLTDDPDEPHELTDEATDPTGSSTRPSPGTSKRKRASSPGNFIRIEERYLDALDKNASGEEEKRLSDLLRLDVQPDPSHPLPMPERPGKPPESELSRTHWRDRTEYEAEWEQPSGTVDPEMFREMELQGQRGLKRRRMLLMGVRRRLEEDMGSEEDEWDSNASSEGEDGEGAEVQAGAEGESERGSDGDEIESNGQQDQEAEDMEDVKDSESAGEGSEDEEGSASDNLREEHQSDVQGDAMEEDE
ncbi:Hypothetical predicted protein [Lecanosticta acicola]|uniref:Uncharacterized protein n=1 Tax=Lecanosticta acicola TaxID=111012 RepID=A0AAI8Z7H1_9PEZI|nr:Hypothetical predicted protein [Lecanosticta acicola]